MTMERASTRVVHKPWGKTDLRPWSLLGGDGRAIGELWFERAEGQAPESELLLKLLFTEEPLSIQVHPDDRFAHAIGLPNGKTEAWYVLAAEKQAQVALGLKRELTAAQLRAAIADGSIEALAAWRDVVAGEALLVPAGTIHAIGAGLVLAEIQQRSDATFRLFDYGRQRDLHVDAGVGAAMAGPAGPQSPPSRLSEAREVMATSRYFVLERLDLAAGAQWTINASCETWIVVIAGEVRFDETVVGEGAALFLDRHRASVRSGPEGAVALMAYAASRPLAGLLEAQDGISLEVMAQRFPELKLGQSSRPVSTLPWEGLS